MSSFDGRLRLPGQAKLPLAVEVDISQERMRLIAGEETVADWPLEGLEVVAESDGFHITVDDEKAVLSVTESTRFAKELGLAPQPPKRAAAKTAPRGAHTDPPAAADVDQFGEVRGRIDEVATALTSDSISPAEAFAAMAWAAQGDQPGAWPGLHADGCVLRVEHPAARLDTSRYGDRSVGSPPGVPRSPSRIQVIPHTSRRNSPSVKSA